MIRGNAPVLAGTFGFRVEENRVAELSIGDSQLELFSRRTVRADSSLLPLSFFFFSFWQSYISFCMLVRADNGKGEYFYDIKVEVW